MFLCSYNRNLRVKVIKGWHNPFTKFFSPSTDSVLGVHVNMFQAYTMGRNLKAFLGSVLPAGLVVDEADQHKVYPIGEKVKLMLQETGYLHIQATKPDTVGRYEVNFSTPNATSRINSAVSTTNTTSATARLD